MKLLSKPASAIISFLKRNRTYILLLFILCTGAFLRLSDFADLARFNADQVRDARVVESMFNGTFPLLGPKAGGTTFHLGPAFYYMEYASGLIFGHNAAGFALFIPILSIASIGLFFLFFRIYFTRNLTLGLTFLYAASFYAIKYSRFAWNPNSIPFFLFAFLLLLHTISVQEKRVDIRLHLLLGVIMGIGMQLHTTLLILMPILFVITHLYSYAHTKSFPIRAVLLTIGLTVLLHAPFIIHDIKNNGANTASFIQGTETKTAKNESLFHNILLDSQFFLQGNTYVLTGMEPQKSWIKIEKLMASKNVSEITLFMFGFSLSVFGLFLLAIRLKQEIIPQRRRFLLLLSILGGLQFLLFLPIAEELNIRFFIGLVFLPFLFLGLIVEYTLKKFADTPRLGYMLIAIPFLILATANIRSYRQTYDLDHYTAKESAYGGISLGEANALVTFIRETKQNWPDATLFILPFEFSRSIEYLLKKENVSIANLSEKNLGSIPQNSVVLFIAENAASKKLGELSEKSLTDYSIIQQKRFGRFTILSFEANTTK